MTTHYVRKSMVSSRNGVKVNVPILMA